MDKIIDTVANVRVKIHDANDEFLQVWLVDIACNKNKTMPFGKGKVTAGRYSALECSLDEVVEFFRDVYRGKKSLDVRQGGYGWRQGLDV